MAIAITDLRLSPDYYQISFSDPGNQLASADLWNLRYAIPLDAQNFSDEGGVTGTICNAAVVPDPTGCVQILSSPYYDQGGGTAAVDLHPGAEFFTTVLYEAPLVGPCPPGFSCFDDQNYGWYVFGINVTARYGKGGTRWLNETKFEEHGRAQGAGRVTIGPIGAYGR